MTILRTLFTATFASALLTLLAPSVLAAVPASASSSLALEAVPAPELDNRCWKVHSPTVHQWLCASEHLPANGAPFALSVWVIESPKLLLILDSGATAKVGRAAAEAISQRFPAKPFYLINTQPKPEHVLGNIGFKEVLAKGLPANQTFESRVVAGQQTAKLMAQRCPDCIARFAERMGGASVEGTQPVIPAFLLTAKRGNLGVLGIGFKPWLYDLEPNLDSEQTLTLRNRDLGLEWVSSLVEPRLVPDLHEGKVSARIDFLGKLSQRLNDGDVLLGSNGRIEPVWIRRNLRYFADLQLDVLTKASQGSTEVEIIGQLSAEFNSAHPELDAKAQEIHQLNIQRVYRQVEDMTF